MLINASEKRFKINKIRLLNLESKLMRVCQNELYRSLFPRLNKKITVTFYLTIKS